MFQPPRSGSLDACPPRACPPPLPPTSAASVPATFLSTHAAHTEPAPPPPLVPYPSALLVTVMEEPSAAVPLSPVARQPRPSLQPIHGSHARALSQAKIAPPPPPPPTLRPAPNAMSMLTPSPSNRSRSVFVAGSVASSASPLRVLPPPLPTQLSSPITPLHQRQRSLSDHSNNKPLARTTVSRVVAQRSRPPPLPSLGRALSIDPTTSASPPTPSAKAAHALTTSAAELKSHAATRAKIEAEILSTERSYCSNLTHFCQCFLTPLRERIASGKRDDAMGDLDGAGVERIAGNLETITGFHVTFLAALEKECARCGSAGSAPPDLARVFLQFAEFFKCHTAYLNAYEAAVMQFQLLRENERFQKFVKDFVATPRKATVALAAPTPRAGGVPLLSMLPTSPPQPITTQAQQQQLQPMDYLIQPVQRLPRYVLLLKELLRHTPSAEAAQIQLALTKIETIASFVNERKRSFENMGKLVEVSLKISGEVPKDLQLIEPHRRLLREGPVQVLSSRGILGVGLGTMKAKPGFLLLFNDMIVHLNDSNKYKHHLALDGAGVIPSASDPCMFQLTDSKVTIFVRGASLEEAQNWTDAITQASDTLREEKESTRRLQRVGTARASRAGSVRGAINFNSPDDEDAVEASSDPQLQADWLEREAAAARKREQAARIAANGSIQPVPSPQLLMPKNLMVELAAKQNASSSRRPSGLVAGSASSTREDSADSLSRKASGSASETIAESSETHSRFGSNSSTGLDGGI